MRELEYRVWYRNKYIELTNLRGEKSIYFSPYDLGVITQSIDRKEAVLEPYTGLKDKNGKEIYEGDILSAFGNYYEVVFENERAGFVAKRVDEPKDDFFAGYFGRYLVKHCEAIGNIHENGDILNDEQN